NFQLVSGEPLNAHAIEEPWRVGGHVRRLVDPVIEVVVTEETNVGHENSCVDIEPVVHVEMVSTVCFREVFVGIADVPLADPGTRIIPWCGDSKQTPHGQDSAANVLPVEVAAHADLFDLDFATPERLGR